MTLRRHAYSLLEGREQSQPLGWVLDAFLVSVILVNVASVMLETETPLIQAYHRMFLWVEVVSVAIFTLEYVLRLWVSAETPGFRRKGAVRGRVAYALTPIALIDMVAILPFYLHLFGILVGVDLRILRLFRLVRILKLAHYSRALRTFTQVLKAEWRALSFALCLVAIMLVLASSLIYFLEREAQPDAFGSIPRALWWAMATMTTVGYGDVVPITPWGRVFGGVVMLMGIGLFALWTGIIASGFSDEIRSREFTVNWDLVAALPLFHNLTAVQLAEIAGLLQPVIVPRRYVIARKGEEAEGLYFISQGEVEVDLPTGRERLGAGDHFGEWSLLYAAKYQATVSSVEETRLLILARDDFETLMERHPALRDQLEQKAQSRRHWSEGSGQIA